MLSTISPDSYAFLQSWVRNQSGIVIEKGKEYLVEARLVPIVRREKLASLDELCGLLKKNNTSVLNREVAEAMTTNETLFFRDFAPFEAFYDHILPALNGEKKHIRLWSAACSTGQEPYSMAMVCLDYGLDTGQVSIRATDYSSAVLARAEGGKYSQIEINRGLPAPYLLKHFARLGLEWQVSAALKKLVTFEQHDLRSPYTGRGEFDVVFCRNVLIYFDLETKRGILKLIRDRICSGGYLILGAAETLLNLDCDMERIQLGSAVVYSKK